MAGGDGEKAGVRRSWARGLDRRLPQRAVAGLYTQRWSAADTTIGEARTITTPRPGSAGADEVSFTAHGRQSGR